MAHGLVDVPGYEHALVIEALNAIKMLPEERRPGAARAVADAAEPVDVRRLEQAAESVGARHTAAPLITALGGETPSNPPPDGFDSWVERGARNSSRALVRDVIRRAPHHAPRVVWEQLTLDPFVARFWARTHGVDYRSPRQILWVRVRRALGR